MLLRVRLTGDDVAIGLLHRLRADAADPAETAAALFALAEDVEEDAAIALAAIHIAAECTTDGDLGAARTAWLELLDQADPDADVAVNAGEVTRAEISWQSVTNVLAAFTTPDLVASR